MLDRMFRYVRTHHVGLLALFVALGGTSYAAIKLPANSVGTKQLKRNAVTLKKINPSARERLAGQDGERGPAGPVGPQGSVGPVGPQGPPGPGAVKLDFASAGTEEKTLFSREGLSIIGGCDITADNGWLKLAAAGPTATANASWTREHSDSPLVTESRQDGVGNGTLTIADETTDLDGAEYDRMEGYAVLRSDTLVVSVVFHVFVMEDSCKIDGTATPAA